MAVNVQVPYKEYEANGITTNFPLEFDCDNQEHLILSVNDKEQNMGDWLLKDRSVVFRKAPTSGDIVKIQRNTPLKRATEFNSYDNSFRPETINKDFDWIWWKLQELGVADKLLKIYADQKDAILKNYVDNQDDKLSKKVDLVRTEIAEYLNKMLPMFFCIMKKEAQGIIDPRFDEKWKELAEYLNTLIPAFSCIMKKEIARYTETELVDVIRDVVDTFEFAVTRVVGKTGSITAEDISAALGLGTASRESVAFFEKQEKSASKVILNNGRTTEEKLCEMPSPFDFGAKGDGKENDTKAFLNLESDFQGRIIDLLGKTYYVDRDFMKNTYINGGLKIGGVNTITTKGHYAKADYKYRVGSGNDIQIAELSALISTGGSASTGTSIFQEVVYHNQKQCYYSTQEWSGSGADELMVLTKYYKGVGGTIEPEKQSLPSGVIGHQGLAITIEDGETYFWTIGGSDINAEKSRHVVKFQFNEETLAIENEQHFRVFGDRYIGNNVRVMDIAPNRDTLVTVGSMNYDVSLVCRVFSVSDLEDPSVDYSESYKTQFYINKPSGYSMQSCCTDGQFVYVIHSSDSKKTAVLDIYTLSGVNILTDFNFTVGLTASEQLTNKYWLPESVFLLSDGNLGFHIAIGKRGNSSKPFTNLLMSTMSYDPKVIKTYNDEPALFLDSATQYGVIPTRQIKTVEVDSIGAKRLRSNITQNINYIYPKSSIGGFYAIQDGAYDARMYVENTLRKGMFQVSASGAIGVYDGTNNKWLFFSSTTGENLTFNTNLVASTDNTKNLGSETVRYAKTFTKQLNFSPKIYLDASTDDSTGQVRIREVGDTADRSRVLISQNWLEYRVLDGSANGGLSVSVGTATEVRSVIGNSVRNIRMQVSNTGNFGFYDVTNSKYLLAFSLDGIDSTLSTNLLPSSTAVKNLGSSTLSFLNTFTNKVTLQGGITVQTGSGTPEGIVIASNGSMYIDSATGDWYQKKGTTNTNIGWIAK